MKGIVYYELLKPNQINHCWALPINWFESCFESVQSRLIIAQRKRKVILLYDNARPRVAKVVEDMLSAMRSLTTRCVSKLCSFRL